MHSSHTRHTLRSRIVSLNSIDHSEFIEVSLGFKPDCG